MLAILGVAGTPKLDDASAWREACVLAGYSCRGVPAPFVVEAPLWTLYGRYRMGDKYIIVDEKLRGNLAYAVRVHEMTHYLQYKRGAWTGTKENQCLMERNAFDVGNVVLRRLGEYHLVVKWDTMRLAYGCPL